VSGLDLTLEPEPAVRRFEVIQGVGGRRRWSKDDKARILELTLALGAMVADSDEVGQLFRRDVGHAFRFQAGHDSDLKSAT
jgi:hypothetical protein